MGASMGGRPEVLAFDPAPSFLLDCDVESQTLIGIPLTLQMSVNANYQVETLGLKYTFQIIRSFPNRSQNVCIVYLRYQATPVELRLPLSGELSRFNGQHDQDPIEIACVDPQTQQQGLSRFLEAYTEIREACWSDH